MVLIVVLLVEADTSRLLLDRDTSMFELLEIGGTSKALEEVGISMFLKEQDRQSSHCHNIFRAGSHSGTLMIRSCCCLLSHNLLLSILMFFLATVNDFATVML